MAGLGRKIFNSGDILLASEVQGYLQDQAVMVFDDSATRATAIGTANFSEGMVTYTKDDDAIQVYDGSDFVGVGSDSGLIHIETVSTGGAVTSISIGSDADPLFSSAFTNYKILWQGTGSSETDFSFRLRADTTDATGNNYFFQLFEANGSSLSGSRTSTTSSAMAFKSASELCIGEMLISNPFASARTTYIVNAFRNANNCTFRVNTGQHQLTDSYNGITFLTGSAATINGTFYIYGFKE